MHRSRVEVGDKVAPSVPLPSTVTCSVPLAHLPHSRCPEFTQWRWWGGSLSAPSPAPCPSLSSGAPRRTSAEVDDPSSSSWVRRGTLLRSPLPVFVWQLDPSPSRCSCEPTAPCEGGGAFHCSATAPSRFVIRQKAADCCNRYFSLKKLRSNLGEPFSMNTFTPERSLFSAST